MSIHPEQRRRGTVYKVRFRDASGASRSVTFDERAAAEAFDAEQVLTRRRAREAAAASRALRDLKGRRF